MRELYADLNKTQASSKQRGSQKYDALLCTQFTVHAVVITALPTGSSCCSSACLSRGRH